MTTTYIDPKDEGMRAEFEKAAKLLSGHTKMVLYFAPPLATGADAEIYTDQFDVTRIHISPGISVQRGFEALLHEAAHAKLNHHSRPTSAAAHQRSIFVDARRHNAQPSVVPSEKSADALADEWLAKAYRLAKPHIKWWHTDEQICIMHLAVLPYINQI